MLIPSRTKYRRVHRLPHEGKSLETQNYILVNMDYKQKKVLGSQLTK